MPALIGRGASPGSERPIHPFTYFDGVEQVFRCVAALFHAQCFQLVEDSIEVSIRHQKVATEGSRAQI
jgi:hypothetical protein